MASPEDDDDLIPETGAVFTFGRSRFADNLANKFWIKNDTILQVTCGDEHSAVLTERGRVYVFGSNDWGQLGLGHTRSLNKPSFIKALKQEKIILLACGRSHTLLYSESGKFYSFGGDEDGQLGHGDKQKELFPRQLESLSGIKFRQLSAGSYHSTALTVDGDVYIWGQNSEGQIGIVGEDEYPTPQLFNFDNEVIAISCGYYHTALVADNGLLYTFGEDENGKLGLTGSQLDNTAKPQPVAALDDDRYIDVSCGSRHTVAITAKGRCYSWGDGSQGQLGHGTMVQEVPEPKQIELLSNFKVIGVNCGESHTAVFTDTGKLFTFGDGRHGKLGQGDECFSNLFQPTLIGRFKGFHVKKVSCGGCHMLVRAVHVVETNSEEEEDDDDEEDALMTSIKSEYSIKGANMTLKPGSMTFPTVSPRDKRRLKSEEFSSSLNGCLNNSLTMAQLSQTLPQLPNSSSLDRHRLPKIPGMELGKKSRADDVENMVCKRSRADDVENMVCKKSRADDVENMVCKKSRADDVENRPPKRSVDNGIPIVEPETKTNKRLVAEISFTRNNKTKNKLQDKNNELILRKNLKMDINENIEPSVVKESEQKLESFNKKEENKRTKLKNIENADDEESEVEIVKKKNAKNKEETNVYKKEKEKPKKEDDDDDDDESEYETETDEDDEDDEEIKEVTSKYTSKLQRQPVEEESEYETDSEEDDDDDEEETIKVKKTPAVNKKIPPIKEGEDEEEESEFETDDEEEEGESEEGDEEEEEEIVKKVKSKGKPKNVKTKTNQKNMKENKKSNKKKVVQDDDDSEEEDEDEDEDEEDMYETDGKKKKKEKNETDDKKNNNKEKEKKIKKGKGAKSKKKQKYENEEDEDDEEEEEGNDKAEETGQKKDIKLDDQNKSGFLNFFRRNKKPQPSSPVNVSNKGTDSPGEKPGTPVGNSEHSRTCVLL